jgi:hypothetical protein
MGRPRRADSVVTYNVAENTLPRLSHALIASAENFMPVHCSLRSVCSFMFLLTLPCSLAYAQTQPDLQTTIDFMSRMVQPEERAVSFLSRCNILVVSDRKILSILPAVKGGGKVITDQSGVDDKFSGYVRLNLADINPDSVASQRAGFSPKTWEEFDNDFPECHKDSSSDHCRLLVANRFAPEHSDMSMLSFRTTDSKSTIDIGILVPPDKPNENCAKLKDGCKGAQSENKQHSSEGGFLFADRDRAQRFVTALVHAVNLCGGRTDTFAPTPERKQ